MKPKKRILFIHIDFYDYNERIKNKIREIGYNLDSFCEDPHIGIPDKIIKQFRPQILDNKSKKKQQKFIKNLEKSGIQYDIIFVIKGGRLNKEFLQDLKRISPNAEVILYMWDDVPRVSNFIENKEVYDRIYSFDKLDSQKYNLIFLPLFYCDDFISDRTINKDLDLFFSGWMHSDRRKLIDQILPVFDEHQMKYYVHLYTGRFKVLKDKIRNRDISKNPSYISYNKISIEDNARLTERSKIILDIQHYTQQGLTMRIFEALSSKCKIITTNTDIKSYDFYNKNNVLIIDRNEPIIDEDFVKTPYIDIPDEVIKKYSLENWLSSIFN